MKTIGTTPVQAKIIVHISEMTITKNASDRKFMVWLQRKGKSRGTDLVKAEGSRAIWDESVTQTVTLYQDKKTGSFKRKRYIVSVIWNSCREEAPGQEFGRVEIDVAVPSSMREYNLRNCIDAEARIKLDIAVEYIDAKTIRYKPPVGGFGVAGLREEDFMGHGGREEEKTDRGYDRDYDRSLDHGYDRGNDYDNDRRYDRGYGSRGGYGSNRDYNRGGGQYQNDRFRDERSDIETDWSVNGSPDYAKYETPKKRGERWDEYGDKEYGGGRRGGHDDYQTGQGTHQDDDRDYFRDNTYGSPVRNLGMHQQFTPANTMSRNGKSRDKRGGQQLKYDAWS